MSTARRLAALLASSLVTLALTAPGPGPADERLGRLRSIPSEERLRLAEKLKAFDALPRDEQEAVRALDAALANEPEENRAEYYAVLRRYHLWLRGLTDAQRDELAKLPPEKRLPLVSKLLAEQKAPQRAELFFDRVADFAAVSPYDLALVIKTWLKLSPQKQAEILKATTPLERARLIAAEVKQLKFRKLSRPSKEEAEADFEKAMREAEEAAKRQGRPRVVPFPKKAEEKIQEKFKHKVGDLYHLLHQPPPKVAPDKLLQFDRALPPWVRAGIEDVPPEKARWLLATLYRLVFPPGQEFEPATAAPAAPKAAAPAPQAPAPASRKSAAPSAAPKSGAPVTPF
jgi:hypothetical protein